MSNVVRLGRMRVGEIADRLARYDEALELRFYDRRIGLLIPMPHQTLALNAGEFHRRVLMLAKEGNVRLNGTDVKLLAKELLEGFRNSEKIE